MDSKITVEFSKEQYALFLKTQLDEMEKELANIDKKVDRLKEKKKKIEANIVAFKAENSTYFPKSNRGRKPKNS